MPDRPSPTSTSTRMSSEPAKTSAVGPTFAKATIGMAWPSVVMPAEVVLPSTVTTADVLWTRAPAATPTSAQAGRLRVERLTSPRTVRDVLSWSALVTSSSPRNDRPTPAMSKAGASAIACAMNQKLAR